MSYYTRKPVQKGTPTIKQPMASEGETKFCLTVTNLPQGCSFKKIKYHIKQRCGPVQEIKLFKDDQTGNDGIWLSYKTKEHCLEAMKTLQEKITRNKIVVTMNEIPVTPRPPSTELPVAPRPPAKRKWRPDLNLWDEDPQGVYGLKMSYLKSLNVTPPLSNWIHVANFRAEKSEIRDVLEMAGQVVLCSVFESKYANVMYSHPLEAVQAVSMLNGQTFYGKKLQVKIDKSSHNFNLLPKGLASVGAGLGANGKPMRTILKQYKRFVTNKTSSVDLLAFEVPQNLDLYPNENTREEKPAFKVQNVGDFKYYVQPDAADGMKISQSSKLPPPPPPPPPPLLPLWPMPINVQSQSRLQKPPIPLPGRPPNSVTLPFQDSHENPGPEYAKIPLCQYPKMAWSYATITSQNNPMQQMGVPMPSAMFNAMPNAMLSETMPGSMTAQNHQMFGLANGSVQVQLSGLSPLMSFDTLCEKMRACGSVESIELKPDLGVAIITFRNRLTADECIQTYNNTWNDGRLLQVKYIKTTGD